MGVEDRRKPWRCTIGKDGSNGEENNNGVDNGIGDNHKHDRQQLTLSPNLFERNLCRDKGHEGMASWIIFIVGSKGQNCDKLWRQKEKYILNERKRQVIRVQEEGFQSNYRPTDKGDDGKWNQHQIYIESVMVKTAGEINETTD